nr:hypothetical protein CFP56_76739 [Quercus suber]
MPVDGKPPGHVVIERDARSLSLAANLDGDDEEGGKTLQRARSNGSSAACEQVTTRLHDFSVIQPLWLGSIVDESFSWHQWHGLTYLLARLVVSLEYCRQLSSALATTIVTFVKPASCGLCAICTVVQ